MWWLRSYLVASKAGLVVKVPATVHQILLREEHLLAGFPEVCCLNGTDGPKRLQQQLSDEQGYQ